MAFNYDSTFEKDKREIPDSFTAKVTDVHDGDTCTVVGDFRSKPVKIRLADINAPEIGMVKGEPGGEASKKWLTGKILGKTVDIVADPKGKFGKYGRLVGIIMVNGTNINEESLLLGFSRPFGEEDPLLDMEKILAKTIEVEIDAGI